MAADPAAPWAEPVLHTARDLASLPDDAWRYELVQGRLVKMPPAGFDHGAISIEIGAVLRNYVRQHRLGQVTGAETGFQVSVPGEADTVLAPDVAFIRAARMPVRDSPERRGFLRLAPDLVVEVASPTQRESQMAAKPCVWLDAGTQLLWVVWTAERSIDVWRADLREKSTRLTERDALEGEFILPGFRYSVAEIFK